MILTTFKDFLYSDGYKYITTGIFIALLVLLIIRINKQDKVNYSRNYLIKRITVISIFSAIAILLYIFGIDINIVIPFMPSFLEVHFSIIPILLITALYGPAYGAMGTVIKTVGKLIIVGSSSFAVGELADVIIGVSVITVFSFFYYKKQSPKNLVIALIAGAATWVVVGVFINWTIIVPFFIYAWNFEAVFGAMRLVPGITEDNYMSVYLAAACLPFNAITAALNALLGFFVIQSLSKIIPQLGPQLGPQENN